MMSTPTRAAESERIHRQLTRAIHANDRKRARQIYYTQVLPNPAFDRREAERLSYRSGAIDEGDRHLSEREDL